MPNISTPTPSGSPEFPHVPPANAEIVDQSAIPSSDYEIVEKVVNNDGWIEIDLTKGTVKQPRRPLENHDRVYFRKVIPAESSVLSLICGKSITNPAMVSRCNNFPFGIKWKITEVIAFDVDHRTFRYTVSATPLDDTSAQSPDRRIWIFTLIDEDGDKTFETVLLKSDSDTLEVPAWALRRKAGR